MLNPLVAAQEKTVERKACSYGKAGVLLGTAEAEERRMTDRAEGEGEMTGPDTKKRLATRGDPATLIYVREP